MCSQIFVLHNWVQEIHFNIFLEVEEDTSILSLFSSTRRHGVFYKQAISFIRFYESMKRSLAVRYRTSTIYC